MAKPAEASLGCNIVESVDGKVARVMLVMMEPRYVNLSTNSTPL